MKENRLELLLTVLYLFLFSLVFLFFISCQDTKVTKSGKEVKIEFGKQVKKELKSNITKKKDSLKEININPNDVVIVVPSSKQIDSLQATMDEDEYSTFVDESSFYINQAKEYCETIHSSVVEVETGESLVFLSEKGTKFPFSTKGLLWEMIVFNGITKPEKIDVTSPQDEMIRVYNKIKK